MPIEYVLVSNSTSVCITCTFLDSSTTDCVAVIHQRISQLNSSGLMNIESSHKFNRSGDTAYGCIEEVNLADYQVGVVGGILIVIVEVTGTYITVHLPFTKLGGGGGGGGGGGDPGQCDCDTKVIHCKYFYCNECLSDTLL